MCVGGLARSLDRVRSAGVGTAGRALKGSSGTRRGVTSPRDRCARERGERIPTYVHVSSRLACQSSPEANSRGACLAQFFKIN